MFLRLSHISWPDIIYAMVLDIKGIKEKVGNMSEKGRVRKRTIQLRYLDSVRLVHFERITFGKDTQSIQPLVCHSDNGMTLGQLPH